jgi:hypothetical protein
VWARNTLSPASTLTANSGVVIPLLTGFESSYGADPIGTTVRRIRGALSLRAGAAGNSIRLTWGIGIFQGLPTVANQGPANQPHLDWMTWSVIFSEPVIATEFATMNNIPIDVRAQRKMPELGQGLYLIMQNTHPTDGLAYAYSTSTLLALP